MAARQMVLEGYKERSVDCRLRCINETATDAVAKFFGILLGLSEREANCSVRSKEVQLFCI